MDRRKFLKASAVLTAASAFQTVLPEARAESRSKRVLLLGGTFFLGPALAEALVASGHTVTIFNRGVTNPELFPNLEKLRGYRSVDTTDQDLSALEHRRFDAIVDVWPEEPEMVASAASMLGKHAQHYVYVSSIGAYDHKQFANESIVTEDAALEPWTAAGRAYNRNKAEAERRLRQIIGDRLTIVRPTAIKGHRDDTPDLLTWLLRAQEGGEHIAPGDGSESVQLVDVKDVARFLVLAIERSLYGTFNLTGKAMSFREFLETCKTATHSNAKFTWIPQQFLHEHGLESDNALHTFAGNFPFWLPEPQYRSFYRVSSEKAFRAGWQTRPFSETALDCLSDFYVGHFTNRPKFLSTPKEKEVLEAWTSRMSH
jgi:2'-hydroxyisoflavone reductase